MNADEKFIENFLKDLGYENIVHEPDGKLPPDFTINNEIAIEVRRLNQHYFTCGTPKGLFTDIKRLQSAIEEMLHEFDEPIPVSFYWITLTFKRPIGNLKSIKKAIKCALINFMLDAPPTPRKVKVTKKLWMSIAQGNQKDRRRFKLCIIMDRDASGGLVPKYQANLTHCIENKTKKVQPFRAKYKRWWLILVDAMGGIPRDLIVDVINNVNIPDTWERIIVVDQTPNIFGYISYDSISGELILNACEKCRN